MSPIIMVRSRYWLPPVHVAASRTRPRLLGSIDYSEVRMSQDLSSIATHLSVFLETQPVSSSLSNLILGRLVCFGIHTNHTVGTRKCR
jgi:hypothetical protein